MVLFRLDPIAADRVTRIGIHNALTKKARRGAGLSGNVLPRASLRVLAVVVGDEVRREIEL